MARESILPEVISVRAGEDRRRSKRIYLQVPLFIRARDAQGGQFMELTKTLDISATGALIVCPCRLGTGSSVTLTIPSPSITSSALVPAETSPIQCKVIRQQELGEMFLVGVEFLQPIG